MSTQDGEIEGSITLSDAPTRGMCDPLHVNSGVDGGMPSKCKDFPQGWCLVEMQVITCPCLIGRVLNILPGTPLHLQDKFWDFGFGIKLPDDGQ